MKKSIILVFALLTTALLSGKVMAQATENTAAGAVIIIPITITETSPLHFGVMSVLAGTPGTCVLSTLGVRTQTAGVNLSAQAPNATNATYDVAGQPNTTYALTFGASTITVTKAITLETMTIDNLLVRFNGAGADAVTSTLDGSGTDDFSVGGTLNVNAGQVAGTYAGTFDVTVAYN